MTPPKDIDTALASLEKSITELHNLNYVGALSKVRGIYSELFVAKKLASYSPVIDSSDVWLESIEKKIEVKSNRRGERTNGDAEYYWQIGKRQYAGPNPFDYLVLMGYDDEIDPLVRQKEFIFTREELKPILRIRKDPIKKGAEYYGIGFFPNAKQDHNSTEYDPADLELSLHPEKYSGKWNKIK